MRLWRAIAPPLPRELRPPPTPGAGGRPWRLIVGAALASVVGALIANLVWTPSKRTIELIAGLTFGGFVLVAQPLRALMFTAFILPYPAYTSVGTSNMLLVFAVAGLVLIKSKQLRLSTPFVNKHADMAILGWALMLILSFYKQSPEAFSQAIVTLVAFVTAVVLYYLTIYLVRDRRHLWTLVKILQVSATLNGVLGVVQYLYPDRVLLPEFFSFSRQVATMEEVRRGQVRVMGTFGGQEGYAEYIALGIVMQYILVRRSRTAFERGFWLSGLAVMLLSLFATQTRGALISLVFGFLYMLVVGARAIPRGQLAKVLFVGAACFYLSFAFVGSMYEGMLNRMSSIGHRGDSVESREEVLRQAIDAIPDSPFLGHGIATPHGTFRGAVTSNIHNLYVTLAYTIGIPGLLFFLWLLTTLWRVSWHSMRDRTVPADLRELMLALHVMLVIFIIDEIKIEYTRQELWMHLTWMMFGLIIATHQVAGRSRVVR